MNIVRKGDVGYIESTVGVYTFEVTADTSYPTLENFGATIAKDPMPIGGFRIIPYGDQNAMPQELRVLLDENNLTPEVLDKQFQLLWGQGPALYKTEFKDGKRTKYWDAVPEIEKFLNDWDFEDYLTKAGVEYRHVNGHFSKYYRNLGFRIGRKPIITELKHISSLKARLEWPDSRQQIKHIITGDFERPTISNLKRFPIFNNKDPFALPISMRYTNMYSFAMDNDYSRPGIFGNRHWIALSSSLPMLLMNYNKNSASIKYHIKSPAAYWEQQKERLEKNCELKGIEYKDKMLDELKDETFAKFAEGLTGIKNVGKFITSETIYDELGEEYVGWEVETLDQKVKDYIDAQINIAKRAQLETTAGLGLHPALSNISSDGNLPSGSEQLYAFKLYLATGVDIPENIVCRDINYAIKANFPNTQYKLGFYHDTVLTEESTKPEDRIKNTK